MQAPDLDHDHLLIRPLTARDLPELEWEGRYVHFRNLYLKTFNEYQQGVRMMLVAEHGGCIIGQIFILYGTIESDPYPDRYTAYLYSLRVRPEMRNKGVGRRLILEAEKDLIRRGFTRVLIAVAKVNDGALRLYERMGYSRIGDDPGAWSYTDHAGRLQRVNEPSFILDKLLR